MVRGRTHQRFESRPAPLVTGGSQEELALLRIGEQQLECSAGTGIACYGRIGDWPLRSGVLNLFLEQSVANLVGVAGCAQPPSKLDAYPRCSRISGSRFESCSLEDPVSRFCVVFCVFCVFCVLTNRGSGAATSGPWGADPAERLSGSSDQMDGMSESLFTQWFSCSRYYHLSTR